MSTVATGSVLDGIVERSRADLATALADVPLAAVRTASEAAPQPRPLAERLRETQSRVQGQVALVAEFKRASPSKGTLATEVDPVDVATRYARAGANAISVLTERHRFLGSLDDLRAVRGAVDRPVLRKDFLFDPYQLYEARAAGADAVLLIVAMLECHALTDLLALTRELGMDALVEVHDEAQLETAFGVGADLIGINNRDLHTFQVDLAVTERLAPLVPAEKTIVGESGVFTAADARRMQQAGVHAVLVGEALMRAGLDGIGDKVREIKSCA